MVDILSWVIGIAIGAYLICLVLIHFWTIVAIALGLCFVWYLFEAASNYNPPPRIPIETVRSNSIPNSAVTRAPLITNDSPTIVPSKRLRRIFIPNQGYQYQEWLDNRGWVNVSPETRIEQNGQLIQTKTRDELTSQTGDGPRVLPTQTTCPGAISDDRAPISKDMDPVSESEEEMDDDALFASLIKRLRGTKITEYSQDTAKATLGSALDQIENEERKILGQINNQLFEKGPFTVTVYENPDGHWCTIPLGSTLMRKIERECGEGSVVQFGDDKPVMKAVVEKMTWNSLIALDSKKRVSAGPHIIRFIYTPKKNKEVLHHLDAKMFFPPISLPATASNQLLEFTHSDKINSIQNRAIVRALQPTGDKNIPFMIRGPPGTGKTTTLVELLLQILREPQEKEHLIIVCTPSNRAADNVIERIPEGYAKVLRFLSCAEEIKLKNKKRVPGIAYGTTLSLKYRPVFRIQVSAREALFPVRETTLYNIIVCTIGMLHHMYSSGIPDVKPTHIIIDEASMVADTDMIMVLGLLTKDTNFVMFGDEKQLGPVIKPDALRNSYLATSMFERLLKDILVERRSSVCLLENYRSAPGIVAPFNNLFYNGELIAKVSEDMYPDIYDQQRRIHQSLMPGCVRERSGVYFKRVKGNCESGESTSWKNVKEAKEIIKIFNSLIKCGVSHSEIGIITPYLDQVKLIQESIDSKLVVIGSVDSFQGQERNVILVSTVRSYSKVGKRQSRSIGFVGDRKRLNVTLSRAKTALIMVGNDDVLKSNKLFRDFFDMEGIHYMD